MAKVLLYSLGAVGKSMAGPAIRYWEFARSLSKKHEVILMVPNECDLVTDQFTIVQKTPGYRKYFKEVDVIITMMVNHSMALAAKLNGVKIILDAYDPLPFELLEIYKDLGMPFRQKEQNAVTDFFNFSFLMADSIICANESQRDLWTGLLLSQKKITPCVYDQDSSLKSRIDIVPFGLPSESPVKKGIGPKSLFKLKDSDKIVLWGGGIWNWFDPLTLIKAIHLISKKRSDVHLVFMGVKPPSIAETEGMSMPHKACKLAEELDMLDKNVHFNPGWIPYEERTSFLLEADIGVSMHFDHLETRYSFRTRLLDYIWAKLPIINTEGDSFARLIAMKGIGLTVPYGNVEAIAETIVHIIDNPEIAAGMKKNLEAVSLGFHWDKIVAPLERMVDTPLKKQSKSSAFKMILQSVYRTRGPFFPLKVLFARVTQRLGLAKVT
ncbi:MAG TPA: glycosyltransferase [Parachlamydiaceae bacterium]|nr:glycosyltransferase [Parachlamydiaceae bacterium]